MKQNPVLVYSKLSHRFYIATSYKIEKGGYIIVHRKHDVTEQVLAEVNPYRLKKAKKTMTVCAKETP